MNVVKMLWEGAIQELQSRGFIEMLEAKKRGLIPMSWQPKPESSEENIHGNEAKIEYL